jgi:LacI family fructose operon transcriptional repressor
MLSFPLLMVRQNVAGLLGEAFRIIDTGTHARKQLVEIKPELMFPQRAT